MSETRLVGNGQAVIEMKRKAEPVKASGMKTLTAYRVTHVNEKFSEETKTVVGDIVINLGGNDVIFNATKATPISQESIRRYTQTYEAAFTCLRALDVSRVYLAADDEQAPLEA